MREKQSGKMRTSANGPGMSSSPDPGAITQRDRLLEILTSNVALAFGLLMALLSLAVSIRNSIRASMDFQWSGARLLLLHRDPWVIYKSGDPRHLIILSQVPNYLHELYVLLLPLGLLPFNKARIIWAICNVFFILVLGVSVGRLYDLDRRKTWLLFVLVFISTPLRVTIANGQSDALALVCVGLWAVAATQAGRGLLLGIAYEKYSFPPVLVIFLLFRKKWKLLAYSMFAPLLGFLFADAWLNTPWSTLALEPFRTASRNGSVTLGWANIMALIEQILAHFPHAPAWTAVLPYAGAVILACGAAAYFAKDGSNTDGRILLACLLTAALACFPHLIYDFLAMIFSLAIALKSKPSNARTVSLVLIAYFWYFERMLDIRHWESSLFVILPSFILLLIQIGATYKLRNGQQWQSQWNI